MPCRPAHACAFSAPSCPTPSRPRTIADGRTIPGASSSPKDRTAPEPGRRKTRGDLSCACVQRMSGFVDSLLHAQRSFDRARPTHGMDAWLQLRVARRCPRPLARGKVCRCRFRRHRSVRRVRTDFISLNHLRHPTVAPPVYDLHDFREVANDSSSPLLHPHHISYFSSIRPCTGRSRGAHGDRARQLRRRPCRAHSSS